MTAGRPGTRRSRSRTSASTASPATCGRARSRPRTSQGPMVGDYISTSFSGGLATTVFAVGKPPTTAAFDEAMYAPTSRLAVATAAQAVNTSSSAGAVTGVGTGEAIRALKND